MGLDPDSSGCWLYKCHKDFCFSLSGKDPWIETNPGAKLDVGMQLECKVEQNGPWFTTGSE